jgi:hypothetical protein
MAKTKSKLTTLTQELTSADIRLRTHESQKWLLKKISMIRSPQHIPRGIKGETYRETNTFGIGGLYCFYYDPKLKKELPYYDKFPLVLVLQKYDDGFLGLNLHYLPIRYRAVFMDKLMDYAITQGDDIMKIQITYNILKTTTNLKEFRPCIKRYLNSHLQSRILAVQPNEWEVATFLPMHQFKKEKAQVVWQDSLEKIKG